MSYINFAYKPKNEIICEFYVEPAGKSMQKTVDEIAGESSIGTWTAVKTMPYMKKLAPTIFSIKKRIVKIAYPIELFEPGNMPEILSSIAGNIFGMKEIKNLRLNNIIFPAKLVKSFKGPKYGMKYIRKFLGIKNRPLLGTIIKPKLGLKTKDHAHIAYDAWIGGCDIVKDDENLTNQKFNPFKERVMKTLEMRDLAYAETGEKKAYMPNITGETKEMIKRAEFIEKHGGKYAMVDIVTCGWSALQTLRNENLNLIIHAHRAGHATFTRNKKHGISMLVLAKIARLIGVDQLHIGTIIGKMEGSNEVIEIKKTMLSDWYNLKKTFPVCSGGLHPRHVPKLIRIFGNNIIIQAGGGIHGHPEGTQAGATAMRQAIDATLQKISLKAYAKNHKELAAALQKWKDI